MNLSWRPQNQLTQSIFINAQVIQSIRLLQFDHEELHEFIQEQCERNPFIEAPGGKDGADPERRYGAARQAPEKLPSPSSGTQSSYGTGRTSSHAQTGDYREIQDRVAAATSLRDHLRSQLGSGFSNAADAATASEVIESLDDDGYLRRPLYLIAEAVGVDEARAEAVLSNIQHMDPAGVGARDLAECLALQLREEDALPPPMQQLLANLHLLAKHEYRQLSILCGVSVDDIVCMADRIKRLDPRPGRRFDNGPVVPAIPDVIVVLRDDGSIVAELNAHALPRVLINRQYYSEISSTCRGAAEVKYVSDCMKDANWLIRNLDQRAQTILKVATEIITRQRDFLLHGVEHLKPLNLKDVADAVGIHQSTVCRAIANKYVMTPRGLHELKFFFANSIATVDGHENVSSDTVRHRIKLMIANESVDAILSDDAIVKELRGEGIDIARRTVAKYREAMHIPSSLQRRRQKEAEQTASRRTPSPAAETVYAYA